MPVPSRQGTSVLLEGGSRPAVETPRRFEQAQSTHGISIGASVAQQRDLVTAGVRPVQEWAEAQATPTQRHDHAVLTPFGANTRHAWKIA